MYPALIFFLLFGNWILFSGRFDLFHLVLGAISSALVTGLSHDFLFHNRSRSGGDRVRETVGMIRYILWLLVQIMLANIHVLCLALHPRMRDAIEPKLVRFRPMIKGEFAKVILANSITLTPGTITVKIEGDDFIVHTISRKASSYLPRDSEATDVKFLRTYIEPD